MLEPGVQFGPYRILSLLGAGGMGEVYRAEDTRLRRCVAVKILPARWASDPQRVARFEREAKAVASLAHPNVVILFDVGRERGVFFAVSELLEGDTLRARLRSGALPWREAVEIATQIAEGLAAAHARGIVHRDLKPENVFLTADGRVKILDFGLARMDLEPGGSAEGSGDASTWTEAGVLLGTAPYMSPEQLRGEPADARSDLFALGCVLREMISGSRTFSGASSVETMASILREEPAGLRASGVMVPERLERILTRCLEKVPARRFQSASDLAYALREVGAGGGSGSAGECGAGPEGKSVAVLPFVNMSGDSENEYFSDGITEDLIGALSQVPGLRVPARTSSYAFKGRQADVRGIARELGVATLVEGSVRRSGDRLRITAQLVDAAGGHHLWSGRYDRQLGDVFAIQDEITRAIVEALRIELAEPAKQSLVRRHTEDPKAYELYLQGRYWWNLRGVGLEKGWHYFELARLEDPDYALAYAGIGDALSLMVFYGAMAPREGMPRAREAAAKAVALDPTLAEPHGVLGFIRMTFDWDLAAAQEAFLRAIALNPRYVPARYWYGACRQAMGDQAGAVAESRRAVEIEPRSEVARVHLAWRLAVPGHHEEALEHLHRVLEQAPEYGVAEYVMGWAYLAANDPARAVEVLEKAVHHTGQNTVVTSLLGYAYGVQGHLDQSRRVVEDLEAQARRRYVGPYELALVYQGLGERERTLELLEAAVEARSSAMPWMRVFQDYFAGLRGDPRFEAVMERVVPSHATGGPEGKGDPSRASTMDR